MKNIILCSDGTGNTGGKVNGTNVWRIFEAIDRGKPDPIRDPNLSSQITFYDDGVGTESWKPLKLLGGATGYGLQRNVERIYAFLIQNYNPGDQIFLFGFSRGAFTVRVLANLLYYCGIADRQGKTPDEIDALAREGVQAYKDRTLFQPNHGAPDAFRKKYGLANPDPGADLTDPDWKGRFLIRFVGVWDTVEAYGLPIDVLTDGFWFLYPLRFYEKGGVRENDLHPLIENAYHALSTDDERHTFHPILWYEDKPYDPLTGKALSKFDICFAFPAIFDKYKKTQKIEQVWFAGMHANVGGGYPQDALSHVPLLWMMGHAWDCGLRYDESLKKEYEQTADINGRQYDSREGLGCYYSYHPRDLKEISVAAGIRTTKIHAGVLKRICNHTQGYAPTGVPKKAEAPANGPSRMFAGFEVVDPGPSFAAEVNTAGRMARQITADHRIWQGRCLYIVFCLWTSAVVFIALYFKDEQAPDIGDWDPFQRFLYAFLRPVLDTLIWLIPSYFQSGFVALRNSPYWLLGLFAVFGVIFGFNGWLDRSIRKHSNQSWQVAYGAAPPTVSMKDWLHYILDLLFIRPFLSLIGTSIRGLRMLGSTTAQSFFRGLINQTAATASVLLLAAILFWWIYPAYQLACQERCKPVELVNDVPHPIDFETTNAMQVTDVYLKAGVKYRISIQFHDDWLDNNLEASPAGLTEDGKKHMPWYMSDGFKRVKGQPWFMLMGSIGPDEDELIPIGNKLEFWAKKSGRLYLFVNDVRGLYWNNKGTATVIVERLVN